MAGNSFQETRDSIGSEPDSFPIALKLFRDLKAYQTVKTIKRVLASDSFIINNPVQGIINTVVVSDGTTAVENILSVKSHNNIFYENLDTLDFVSDDSTGTHNNSGYTLLTGEVLESEIIAANNTLYTKATISITGTGIVDDIIQLSADGGTTWETVSNNIEHTFNNSSITGIKYKINNTVIGPGFPTPWSTWGIPEIATTSVINLIKIIYS